MTYSNISIYINLYSPKYFGSKHTETNKYLTSRWPWPWSWSWPIDLQNLITSMYGDGGSCYLTFVVITTHFAVFSLFYIVINWCLQLVLRSGGRDHDHCKFGSIF